MFSLKSFCAAFALISAAIVAGGLVANGKQSDDGGFDVPTLDVTPPVVEPVKVIEQPAVLPKEGIADGVIDSARDRAITKAGLTWADIQETANTIKAVNAAAKAFAAVKNGEQVAQVSEPAQPLPPDFVLPQKKVTIVKKYRVECNNGVCRRVEITDDGTTISKTVETPRKSVTVEKRSNVRVYSRVYANTNPRRIFIHARPLQRVFQGRPHIFRRWR